MNERGSTLPLVAGLLSLSAAFTVGVIDSTDLAIARNDLQSRADGAALAAAQTISPDSATISGGTLVVALTPRRIARDVSRYLSDSAATGIRVESATTTDRRTAVVTLSTWWRPPIASEFMPIRVRLVATARARTILD